MKIQSDFKLFDHKIYLKLSNLKKKTNYFTYK
jgi:hypothetical protein